MSGHTGDDRALETLLELEQNPRPWQRKLYVGPSVYAQCGGWTFDKEGRRTQLNFDTCYPMVKGTPGEESPVRIGRLREDTCPHCGGWMVDMLVLDGQDERLKFSGPGRYHDCHLLPQLRGISEGTRVQPLYPGRRRGGFPFKNSLTEGIR